MKQVGAKLGYAVIIALALLPCIYLLYIERALFSADFNYLMRLAGRLSALFGTALFALAFLLNTRIKFLEDLFGGMDKMYRAHHIFGTVAFLSLLLHPLFLAGTYAALSVAAAASFLFPGASFVNDLGIYGLFTMELFLIFTFFARTMAKYQNWKFVHRLLGLSFILGSLHVLLVSSDVRTNAFMRYYMVLVVLVGLLSYVYRTLFWRRLVKQYSYNVSAVKPLGSAITELLMSPEKDSVSFLPGQFIFISIESEIANREQHPFTISSAPADRTLRLSIKNLGDYTSGIGSVASGTKVKIEGPYGRFCPSYYSGKAQLWIAGGIGITPFLSMVRSIEKYPTNSRIDLYYCTRDTGEAVFLPELMAISEKNKNLNVISFCSMKKGRINAGFIEASSKDLKEKEIFICGPATMMADLKAQFIKMGVSRASIHLEEFEL